jgi:hypothetical protein
LNAYPFTRYTRLAYCRECNLVYLFEPTNGARVSNIPGTGRVWIGNDSHLLMCPHGHTPLAQTTRRRMVPQRPLEMG